MNNPSTTDAKQIGRVVAIVSIISLIAVIFGVMLHLSSYFTAKVSAATACPTTSPTGSAQTAAKLPLDVKLDYKIWTRMQVPASTSSYYLKVSYTDAGTNAAVNTCYKVIGSNLAANTWGWVQFENGNTGSPISIANSSGQVLNGNVTLQLIGNDAGVKLDRLLLVSDSCTPTGTGDNCANVFDALPSISFVEPAAGTTITTGNATVTTSPVDDNGITKVNYYLDNSTAPFQTQSAAPYTFGWNLSGIANGTHTIKAEAIDTIGQKSSATVSINVQTPSTTTQTTTPTVTIATPTNGATVSGTSAVFDSTVSGASTSTISKVEFFLDNTISMGVGTLTQSGYAVYWNSTVATNGSHTITSKATIGTSVYTSAPVTTNVSNPINVPPSTPSNLRVTKTSPNALTIAWNASTSPNAGTISYRVYLNNQDMGGTTSLTKLLSGLSRRTTYKITVVAIDPFGLQSSPATLTTSTK